MKTIPAGRWLRNHLLTVALMVALANGGPAAAADPVSEIQIGFMNGVYEDLGSNLEPIRQGSIVIRVSSPEHRLTVHANRLRLTPQADGTFAAVMEVDFEGSGHLIADVEGIGRFEDLVEAPRQTARAAGAVRLARSAAGYLFTVTAADPFVRLEIVSGVARQVAGACRALSLLPFVDLPCGGLEAALSTVLVPMPAPGKQFEVPAGELSAEEKAFFDRFAAAEPQR